MVAYFTDDDPPETHRAALARFGGILPAAILRSRRRRRSGEPSRAAQQRSPASSASAARARPTSCPACSKPSTKPTSRRRSCWSINRDRSPSRSTCGSSSRTRNGMRSPASASEDCERSGGLRAAQACAGKPTDEGAAYVAAAGGMRSSASRWTTTACVWCIAGAATLGVIVRPFGVPEFIWAVLGAAALVALGLLPWRDALAAAGKGTDVYLFLGGMMLLAEVARAGRACSTGWRRWRSRLRAARRSGCSCIVYGVGTLVTIFLSNDATAVVLTPAVYAAATRGASASPCPICFVCAFIANAASFVLPISNPANLVHLRRPHAAAAGRGLPTSRCPRSRRSSPPMSRCASRNAEALNQTIAADVAIASAVAWRRHASPQSESRLTAVALLAASALGPAARPADVHRRRWS